MAQPELKIDYSRIPQAEVVSKSSYRPPRHVFFGKRDPESGMMEEEPQYVHQEYPRMVYKKEGATIIADLCHNDSDMTQFLNTGWVKNLAEVGYLSAPSFEEHLKMKGIGQTTDVAATIAADTAAMSATSTDTTAEPDTGAGQKKWRDMNAAERAAFQAAKQKAA